MNTDKRGIKRGVCKYGGCSCRSYEGGSEGLKCRRCNHPPGKHENLTSSPAPAYSTHSPTAGAGRTQSYAGAVDSMGAGQTRVNNFSTPYQATSPYSYPMCKADGCNNPAYVDQSDGVFDYCTPACRDRHLLPIERKRLEDELKKFSDQIRASSASSVDRESSYSSSSPMVAQASGSSSMSSRGVSSGTHDTCATNTKFSPSLSDRTSPSKSQPVSGVSGKQVTFKTQFQKGRNKELGLILGADKFRNGAVSGFLVLGVEYGTKAEHLLERGDVHLLDVVTEFNGEELNPFSYGEQIKRIQSVAFTLNREIALPTIEKLFEKAKGLRPTHVFAVMNPQDLHSCSVQNGFGLNVTGYAGTNLVSGVTENTPARITGLKFDDEIIAHAFTDKDGIVVQKGFLEIESLKTAEASRKTLVLIVKRKYKV